MIRGFLLYNKEDYEKNKWFAGQFLEKAGGYGLALELLFTDDLSIGTDEGVLTVFKGTEPVRAPDFIINRSRNSMIARQFELLGTRLFNSASVTELCNDKIRTHQLINSTGIKSVKTIFHPRGSSERMAFPVVVKTTAGHGGHEVFRADNAEELSRLLDSLEGKDILLQEMCPNAGVDIRVFALGKEIIAAVRRYSANDFKANYTLGGQVEPYDLHEREHLLVQQILELLDCDLVGIDFLVDDTGELLFNEIEDAVGTRTLYKAHNLNIVEMYLDYIRAKYV